MKHIAIVFVILGLGLAPMSACGGNKKSKAKKSSTVKRKMGEPCKSNAECRSNLVCVQGTCAPQGGLEGTPAGMERAYELGDERRDEAIRKLEESGY